MSQFKDEHLIDLQMLGAVKRVVNAGLMIGTPDGYFHPKEPLTREQAALILSRLFDKEQEMEDEDRIALLKMVADSVVQVNVKDALGSGVIVNAEKGYVLTNAHVVGDNREVEVLWKSGYASQGLPKHVGPKASVLAVDEVNDLALLQIDWLSLPKTTQVTIAEDWKDDIFNNLNHIGKRLLIQGSPLGFGGRFTEVIFDGIRTMLEDGLTYMDLEGHVNFGNSGGPIFNTAGELVGIVCAKLVGEGVEGFGIGIPLSRIIPFLKVNGEM